MLKRSFVLGPTPRNLSVVFIPQAKAVAAAPDPVMTEFAM
jgi:hypothetical protein